MKNQIYTLYNKLSARYGDVLSFPSDGFAIARLSENLGKAIEEIELCRIGIIDIDTGVIEPCAPVRIAWPEHIANMPVKEV